MSIEKRIEHIKHLMNQAANIAGRDPKDISLLAVSKGQPSTAIKQAINYGIEHVGENYLQESLEKMAALPNTNICWHFIGPIQSNKAKDIATHFQWVHSIDRIKVTEKINQARSQLSQPLNVCLQVNLDDEPSKAGIHPESLSEIIKAVLDLPHLKLRGLMAIPKALKDEEQQYQSYMRLNHLLTSLNETYDLSMDTLSMGMSNDYVAAIRAGSTIIRVGRAIFGERQ
jgi:PLP dependent protein